MGGGDCARGKRGGLLMSEYLVENTELTGVANAIRVKGGTSALLEWPEGFKSAIAAIPTGITPTGTKNITANGDHDVTSYATARVEVPNTYVAADEGKVVSNGALVSQTAHAMVTSNGTIDTTLNNSVTVSVPQPSGTKHISIVNNGTTVEDVTQYANAEIEVNVSIPDPPDESKPVKFYDYDGTLLYSYSLAEVQELTELPTQPVHDGLTAKGWNWTLADIKAEIAPVIVGAHYAASDGVNRFYITIPDEHHAKIDLYFRLQGTAEIDWGDGTVETLTLNMYLTSTPPPIVHEYAMPGDYCIGLKVTSGKISGAYSNEHLLKFAYKSNLSGNTQTANRLLKRVIGGDDTHMDSSMFTAFVASDVEEFVIPSLNWLSPNSSRAANLSENYSLKFLSLPSGTLFANTAPLQYCTFEAFSIPKSLTKLQNGMFKYCTKLKHIAIPSGMTALPYEGFNSCYSLKKVYIPSGVTSIGGNAFGNCQNLASVSLPAGLTSIGTSAFAGCVSLTYVKFPASLTSIGATAFQNDTNIVTYDFTDWTSANLDACSFGANMFQNLTADTKILFKYKSISDHAASVTNLATYAAYFDYEEDDT
jgi:hypothetical protein